jgi:hypothetical protein
VTALDGAPAALEHLTTALGPSFVTTLVTGTGRKPHLSVISRDTYAAEDVYADEAGCYWWPWAERIAATEDPLAAAYQVSAALRGTAAVGGQR